MGLPANGFSNDHWALRVSVAIQRRHSKHKPDSSYEGEESDQRYLTGGEQRLLNLNGVVSQHPLQLSPR